MLSFEENQVQDILEICALEIITLEDVLNHSAGAFGLLQSATFCEIL